MENETKKAMIAFIDSVVGNEIYPKTVLAMKDTVALSESIKTGNVDYQLMYKLLKNESYIWTLHQWYIVLFKELEIFFDEQRLNKLKFMELRMAVDSFDSHLSKNMAHFQRPQFLCTLAKGVVGDLDELEEKRKQLGDNFGRLGETLEGKYSDQIECLLDIVFVELQRISLVDVSNKIFKCNEIIAAKLMPELQVFDRGNSHSLELVEELRATLINQINRINEKE
jgi:hypothetical protein